MFGSKTESEETKTFAEMYEKAREVMENDNKGPADHVNILQYVQLQLAYDYEE